MENCLIVGLGNPGGQYELTRHNIGFLVVEKLAERWQCSLRKVQGTPAVVSEWKTDSGDGILAMPSTFMNKSGIAVKHFVKHQQIAIENVLIICDDLNLPFGRLRVRAKGSSGGQNGLKSIIDELGTQQFARLRVGIGQPPNPADAADFVLDSFNKKEKEELGFIVNEAADCCEHWIKFGTDEAMTTFNQRGEV